jgi:hypothetical protein
MPQPARAVKDYLPIKGIFFLECHAAITPHTAASDWRTMKLAVI